MQAIQFRTPLFDSSFLPMLAVEDVQSKFKPPGIWLNIQVQLIILFSRRIKKDSLVYVYDSAITVTSAIVPFVAQQFLQPVQSEHEELHPFCIKTSCC
jgi:hypothetical protein